MNFTKVWDDKQTRVERLTENIYKTNNLLLHTDKKEIEDFDMRCKSLSMVSKIFNISIDKVKELIPWNSYIMQCEEGELRDKYNYFKAIFGDDLLKVINLDHINNYRGFFSYENKEIVLNKVENLKNIFNIDKKGLIRFLSYSPQYLHMSTEEIKEHIYNLQDYLLISYKESLNILITYPDLIEVSYGLILSRVERLCKFFSCCEDDIKNMYRIYPPALRFTPSIIDIVLLRYNLNRTPVIKKQILLYPWIINCISKKDTNEYCGFSSLSQLLIVAEYITNKFGKIILVKKINWNKYNIGVTYLLVKSKQGIFYFLCLGASSPEEMLLKAIFKDDVSHTIIIQIINKEDLYNIDRYVLNAYFCFNTGLRGIYLKDGTSIIELKYEYLTNLIPDLPANYVLNRKNINIEYIYLLNLNEEYTEKHKAYYQNKRLANDKCNNFDNDLNELFNAVETEKFNEDENKREFNEFIGNIWGTKEDFLYYFTSKFNIEI